MLQLNQNTNDLNIILNNINNLEMGGNELIVTAPTGSTITATKDGVTKTASEDNGVWSFKGLESGYWTVTVVNGSLSETVVMNVTTRELDVNFGRIAAYTYTGNSEIKHASDYGLSGDYEVLALTSSGTLTFNDSFKADVFMVGGGGGAWGGGINSGSGGGGGGYTSTEKNIAMPTTPITISIGAGGSGYRGSSAATNGGSTSFDSHSVGGGYAPSSSTKHIGGNGGSGGGGAGGYSTGANAGTGGSNGSAGNAGNNGQYAGGSGQGTTTRAFGEDVNGVTMFAGGGGASAGAYYTAYALGSAGGEGGGGDGSSRGGGTGLGGNGGTNTGGGGGSGYHTTEGGGGGNGGSGIILIRRHK